VTADAVYRLLARAESEGLIRLCRELDSLALRAFSLSRDDLVVVEASPDGDHVATAAAELVSELVSEIRPTPPRPVGLGLGPGRTTLDFSRSFSDLVRSQRLVLYGITGGALPEFPQLAPVSFFNLFPAALVEARGLFSEPLVPAEFPRQRPGVQEVFAERDFVDIVVTAMGVMDDPHDHFRLLLARANVPIEALIEQGVVGNVQYRPYTERGPWVEEKSQMRAVTLFELSDFARLATEKRKHVVLLVRPCRMCGATRSRAVLPLLTNEKLRVWDKLVIDASVARDVLQEATLASDAAGAESGR
jgi:DNA-binding transcriptional regulator LsrR (DeoR family)